MRKFVLGLFILVMSFGAFCLPAQGQLWPGSASKVLTRPTLPANCEPRNGQIIYLQTGNRGIYSCTETNIWTRLDTSGTFNVKAFGALGNGAADDSAAIVLALAAMNAPAAPADRVGTLFFPRGSYRYNTVGGIVLGSGQSLKGEGPLASRLNYFNAAGLGVSIQGTATVLGKVTVEGISLTNIAGGLNGIVIGSMDGIVIQNCVIQDWLTNGINATLAGGGRLRGLDVLSTSILGGNNFGVTLDDTAAAGALTHVAFKSVHIASPRACITVTNGIHNLTVDNCRMSVPLGAGVYIIGAGGTMNNSSIVGSHLDTASDVAAILIPAGSGIFIGGNHILNSVGAGAQFPVNIGVVAGITVTGNEIVANGGGVTGTPTFALMAGNLITTAGLQYAATIPPYLVTLTGQPLFTTSIQANLGAPPNGTLIYCTDCTIANPCAGAGPGALAKRVGGAWVCN